MNESICDLRLRFFGAIGASLSHELNNVYAILAELSGLLDDFIVAAMEGREPNFARMKNTVERMDNQLRRGTRYTSQLNRFAHSSDHPRAQLNVNEVLEEIVELSQRFARLAKMEIRATYPNCAIVTTGCSFDLQHVIFRALSASLKWASGSESIHIELNEANSGFTVTLLGSLHLDEEAADSHFIPAAELAQALGGNAQRNFLKDGSFQLVLTLPSQLATREPGKAP